MSLFNYYPHVTPSNAHVPNKSSLIQVGSKQVLKKGYNICIYSYISHKRGFQSQISTHRKDIHHEGITNMTTMMLGSSCGANTMIEQERDSSSYFHKPIVQRWTTPFSSWWCWCRSWSGRRSLRWRLRRRIPLLWLVLTQFRCFWSTRRLLSETRRGTFI